MPKPPEHKSTPAMGIGIIGCATGLCFLVFPAGTMILFFCDSQNMNSESQFLFVSHI